MGLRGKMSNQIPAQILRRPQNEDNLKDKDDKRSSHKDMVLLALLSFFMASLTNQV